MLRGAVILLHGRGATAHDILGLSREWEAHDVLFLAPRAERSTWYPRRFVAPLHENEPQLSSALDLVSAISEGLAEIGIGRRRQIVLGFSQGGCLALEWGAREGVRFGGLVGLSGGLIGPPGIDWGFTGSLAGTPVFLGCGVPDPHIPEERVEESADVLRSLGGRVDIRLYPGLGHAVNQDEIDAVRQIIAELPPDGTS